MTPRPNVAGYVVLAAFVAAGAWAMTAKAAPKTRWLDVVRNRIVTADLVAQWDPSMTPPEMGVPDHWDSDWSQWVWLVNGVTKVWPMKDVLVEPREKVL